MPLIRSKKDKSKNACSELSIVTTMAILGLFKDKLFKETYRKNTDEDNALPEGNETIDIEFEEVEEEKKNRKNPTDDTSIGTE